MKNSFAGREPSRWMRPDASNFVRPDWRRFVTPDSEAATVFARYEKKYRPDQPRTPAGNREGGRWTTEGNGSSEPAASETPANSTARSNGQVDVAARISPSREAECEMQYRKDSFICNLVRTRSCWAQAMFRRAQCISGGYIPPLYH